MHDQHHPSIPNSASNDSLADAPYSTWLTAAEAAQYLKIKTRTLLFWARSGKVKAYPLIGIKRRVWRFRQCDLDTTLFASAVLTSSSSSAGSADRRQ